MPGITHTSCAQRRDNKRLFDAPNTWPTDRPLFEVEAGPMRKSCPYVSGLPPMTRVKDLVDSAIGGQSSIIVVDYHPHYG